MAPESFEDLAQDSYWGTELKQTTYERDKEIRSSVADLSVDELIQFRYATRERKPFAYAFDAHIEGITEVTHTIRKDTLDDSRYFQVHIAIPGRKLWRGGVLTTEDGRALTDESRDWVGYFFAGAETKEDPDEELISVSA